MAQRQTARVQKMVGQSELIAAFIVIKTVANQRMANCAQVHADLVRHPGLDLHFEKTQPEETVDRAVVGDRRPSLASDFSVPSRRTHAAPISGIVFQWEFDDAARWRFAPDKSPVKLSNLPPAQLSFQSLEGIRRLGRKHNTGGLDV